MDNERDRLLAWRPGAERFTRDDIILAVGLQCRAKQFLLSDVLAWLGPPDKAAGTSAAGHLAYFYSADAPAVPIFDVSNGRVVHFSTVSRLTPNAKRIDPETGKETALNVLDLMVPFDETDFR